MIAFAALRTRTMSAMSHHGPQGESDVSASGPLVSAVMEALNWLEYGVLLVDGGSRVHFVSGKSQAQLRSGQLCIQGGQLRAPTIGETVILHRLIACYARIDQSANDHAACCSAGELLLQLAPLAARRPADTDIEERLVAVFVMDPDSVADPRPEQLRLQFGLTAAEAGIACEIVRGEGLKECAGKIGISITTARTHLHRIFEKTGTNRQAQLVRAVVACRPLIRRS